MLWRVRTTLADRPGALAALAQRCGARHVNILGLQIFPGPDTVTDEVVLRTPQEWGLADVAALVEDAGGRMVSVAPCTAHALTDAPTLYVRAAMRLVEEPEDLPVVLDDVLGGQRHTGVLAAVQDRLEVGEGVLSTEVRRTVPFTETERARAGALAELAALAARRPGAPAERPAAVGDAPAGPLGGSAQHGASPAMRFGQVTDAAAVVRMHARCSPDVLLRRYHAPMPGPTWRSARRLLSPPGGGSLLAVVGAEIVGMAVVAPYHDGAMEVGLLVEDRWQRLGVGSALLHLAARFAVGHGATDLVCSMRADNRSLLPTVQRSGLSCRLRASAGTVDVRIPLHDVPAMDLGAVGTEHPGVLVSG